VDALIYAEETTRLPVQGAVAKLLQVLELACQKILGATCPYRKLDPAVLMMKSAEYRLRTDLTEPLNGTRERRIFGEGEMCPDVL
jgi:hypothetical protein